MNFDGTVTLGTLVVVATAIVTVLGVFFRYVGAKYFPTKDELASLRAHVLEQLAVVRQDLHNAVADADKVATREATTLERQAAERYVRASQDFARLELLVNEAITGARAARSEAKDAQHEAEKARNGVARIEKDK